MSPASAAAPDDRGAVVLAVRSLCVTFRSLAGPVEALRSVTLHARTGEKIALVGEFGIGQVDNRAGGSRPVAGRA